MLMSPLLLLLLLLQLPEPTCPQPGSLMAQRGKKPPATATAASALGYGDDYPGERSSKQMAKN